MKETRVFVGPMNCVTPLGFNLEATFDAVTSGQSAIAKQPAGAMPEPYFAARIDREKLSAEFPGIETSVLQKMMLLALIPLIRKVAPPDDRTGLIVSTTKGDIDALETGDAASARIDVLAKKIARTCGFKTEPITVSSACVSGIVAVGIAKRLIDAGMFDRVFIVAGDLVTRFVLSGFSSFQAMSNEACKPYSAHRNGVTLGEAAAAVLISGSDENAVAQVLGESAVNDANHISGPSRTGEGLFRSVTSALEEANLSASDIQFVSAHGTATPFNDEMESIAFERAGLSKVALHSLKGIFGHTLGASGLLETVIGLKAMQSDLMIGSRGFDELGVSGAINVLEKDTEAVYEYLLKTASGFGGCNTAVIFKKTAR